MYLTPWQNDDSTIIKRKGRYYCSGAIPLEIHLCHTTLTTFGSVMQLFVLNFDCSFWLSLSFPPSSSFIHNYAKYFKNNQETQPMFNLKFYLGSSPCMQSQLLLESPFTDRLIVVFTFQEATIQQPVFLCCSNRRLKEDLVSHKLGLIWSLWTKGWVNK